MDSKDIKEYAVKRRARNVADTTWRALPGENKLSRRLYKLQFIQDHIDPSKFVGVHLEVLYQKRKKQTDEWPSRSVDLSKLEKGFGFKFSLDSQQTLELAQALQDAYPLGEEGVSTGTRTVVRGAKKEQIIVAEQGNAELLRKLTSEDISKWLETNLEALPTHAAIARIYQERKESVTQFREALERDEDEHFWQDFLKKHDWMFGSVCVDIISERRLDIHHTTDFPLKAQGGFMDIAEIKKPGFSVWRLKRDGEYFKYREKFLVPDPELQGAVAQMTKYILQAEKGVSNTDYIADHSGLIPLKPRGIVIHGRSNDWSDDEWEASRLFNDELHTIQVLTFDQLLAQAERILAIMQAKEEKVVESQDTGEIDPMDIPF